MKKRNNIGKKIVLARKEAGFTQEEFAKKMGKTRQTIYTWENELFIPTIKTLKKIAEITKKPFSFFIEDNSLNQQTVIRHCNTSQIINTSFSTIENKEEMRLTIKDKIRKAIKEAGLTQQGLADVLGITNPVVNTWVTGKRNPTVRTLKKIAAATGKPLDFFLQEDNSANQTAGRDNNGTMTQNIGTASAAEISRLADKIEILSLKMDKIIALLEKGK